ncbi:hypothetical protein O181_105360 [Austropuccinia psidii MF-1]|uniref:Uncharacterized protein n=1 Tax=Austropuccinia psidii MF-1 TaxID=1389203 RepID=A0A9Q3JQB8_9BASI|nr:hypothetical protein [Austropuccinia psidii MF-1]
MSSSSQNITLASQLSAYEYVECLRIPVEEGSNLDIIPLEKSQMDNVEDNLVNFQAAGSGGHDSRNLLNGALEGATSQSVAMPNYLEVNNVNEGNDLNDQDVTTGAQISIGGAPELNDGDVENEEEQLSQYPMTGNSTSHNETSSTSRRSSKNGNNFTLASSIPNGSGTSCNMSSDSCRDQIFLGNLNNNT